MNRIETIAIGDELLTGKISDTNSAWVARELFKGGFSLSESHCIPDDTEVIKKALREAGARSDAVLVFGGLGPTSDDKTAAAAAEVLGTKLVEHAPSKARLLKFLEERGRTVNETVLKQVLFPEGTDAMRNPAGLAPGFRCVIGRARFYFFPGVPHEMKAMFDESARASLMEGAPAIHAHTWRCLGLPESELQRLMNPIEARLPAHAYLGYRTRFPENHLTLYVRGDAAPELEKWKPEIRAILAPFTYTEEDKEPEHLVLDALKGSKHILVVTESCTGGMVSQRLTAVPGVSDRFWGGYICYDYRAKNTMLDVKVADADAAVSAETTRRLAQSALAENTDSDVSLAITGYLGPTGGTKENPLGTLYVCVAGKHGMREKRFVQPHSDRERSQWGAATSALCELYFFLEENKKAGLR